MRGGYGKSASHLKLKAVGTIGYNCYRLGWEGFLSNAEICPKRFANSRQCCVRRVLLLNQVKAVTLCGVIQLLLPKLRSLGARGMRPTPTRKRTSAGFSESS